MVPSLLTSTRKCNHVTLVVKLHYWLTIRLEFVFKLLSFAPLYISEFTYLPILPGLLQRLDLIPEGIEILGRRGQNRGTNRRLHIREASSLAAFNYSLKTIWFFGFCYLLDDDIFMVLSFIACAIEYTFVLHCTGLCYNEEF